MPAKDGEEEEQADAAIGQTGNGADEIPQLREIKVITAPLAEHDSLSSINGGEYSGMKSPLPKR